MRSWVPVLAPAVALAVLLAGCSEKVGGNSQPPKLTPLPSAPHSSTTSTTTTTTTTPTAAPAPGAPIGAAIAWIAAGKPVSAEGYHTATREGTTTQLGDDIAFVTPSGKTQCTTFSQLTDALLCLVQFKNPPPPPADIEGHWTPGWVQYDGKSVSVGGIHGDPGPFGKGNGPQLAYGNTLKFGNFQCRVDEVGLYCANLANQTAARFSDAGVEPFGCLKPATPPRDIGLLFSC
ncbi:MAG TPA: hypothetical protein VFB19_18390 [Mycobacterium sp.]|nr:hypothetical protein [Mycobacterium sp.]